MSSSLLLSRSRDFLVQTKIATALACFNDLPRWEFADRRSDEFSGARLTLDNSSDNRPGSKYLIRAMH